MSTTISMSREELQQRRQDLLDRLGMTYDELQARANSYLLEPNERKIFEAIKAIDYLLGDC